MQANKHITISFTTVSIQPVTIAAQSDCTEVLNI